ncbi:cyclic AMP-dependent transcription factor ATF-4-like [Narcine bancroftii]|uniref:cyclic AMP-dependent transcription factor ATF-4-like n=1 Tax=Narcine bancroftii TaxID=1343680 RepID=UPI0038310EF1
MSVLSDSPISSLMEDYMSYLDSPFLMADEDPCLLHTGLEAGPVKPCLRSHQFGGNEESEVSSQCPCIDPMDTSNVEDAFTGLDWMVEKVDLFDTLNEDENGCLTPDDLLAALGSSCDLLVELPFDPLPAKEGVDFGLSLELSSSKGLDQLAPGTPTVVPESIFFTDEKLIDISVVEEKPDFALLQLSALQDPCEKIDEGPILDSDSGLGSSPPHSPVESLDRSVSERSPETKSFLNDFSPARSKPYDRPSVETEGSSSKVNCNSVEPKNMQKKLKKMEQNKSAATRYRQKKRAEQGAIAAEYSLLEEKNKTLREKADSLTKEIQYLKGLIEEVRRAKSTKSL